MTGGCHELRVFTRKELEYLNKLKERNSRLLEEKDQRMQEKHWYQGLSNNMSPNERQMRRRIRRKAITALIELALVGVSGLLPDRKLRKKGINSIVEMLKDFHTYMLIEIACGDRVPSDISTAK